MRTQRPLCVCHMTQCALPLALLLFAAAIAIIGHSIVGRPPVKSSNTGAILQISRTALDVRDIGKDGALDHRAADVIKPTVNLAHNQFPFFTYLLFPLFLAVAPFDV